MLQYIIKLSISISVVYLFYQLFLRRLTFYTLNRWYLLVYSLLCFVIPFINVFTIVTEPALQESELISYIPAIEHITQAEPRAAAAPSFNPMQIVIAVIITGMLLMLVRLAIQYYSLFKMRSKAVLLYDDKVKLYHIDEQVIPFSFGRSIYVNQHQHTDNELKEIIRHEFIHVKQRHSLDMLWSELLCIINWYNPFAWLLRHAMRQNLEFIADQQVLKTGLDRKQYQYLLLKVVGVNSFSIATNFNFSSLKKRIAMMNKAKSAKVHLIRFLFILPLLVVILLAFRNTTQQTPPVLRGPVTDTVPASEISSMHVIKTDGQNYITITLKNGQVEKYNLNNSTEKAAFESRFGAWPELPKPPVPATSPAEPKEVLVKPGMPVPTAPMEAPAAPAAPPAPAAPRPIAVDCFNKKGYCITIADNYGECVVIVKNKNNKIIEAVSLADWNKDKQYEKKYGEIPPPPPPVQPDVVAVFPNEAITVQAKQVILSKPEVVISAAKPASAPVVAVKPKPAIVISGSQMASAVASISGHAAPVVKSSVAVSGVPAANAQSVSEYRESGNVIVAQGYAASAGPVAAVSAQPAPALAERVVTGYKKQTAEEMAVITKYTTRDDLEKISKTLKDNGFTLEVHQADYRNGLLTAISIKIIDSHGKKHGSFATTEMRTMKIAICKTKNEDGTSGIAFQGK